jgi:hypothetical protein
MTIGSSKIAAPLPKEKTVKEKTVKEKKKASCRG